MDVGIKKHNKMTQEEIEKTEQIFHLMVIAKMTLTEINSLTDEQRIYLHNKFLEKLDMESKAFNRNLNNMNSNGLSKRVL